MDNKDVPYIVHEGDMARMERTNKRLWIIVIMLILLLIASNTAWLMYASQFDDKVTYEQEVEQDASDDGNNQFIGGDYNGKAESKN
jgi:hypothetical protein